MIPDAQNMGLRQSARQGLHALGFAVRFKDRLFARDLAKMVIRSAGRIALPGGRKRMALNSYSVHLARPKVLLLPQRPPT